MALTKAKKHQKVTTLAADLQSSTSAIVGTFTGLTAEKDISLRKTVRDAGGHYHVVKNKLAPKAAAGTQIEGALLGLKGVSSVAYTSGDPVALAKALSSWVKDNAEFTFKLGIVEGKVIDVSEIQALATLPGKEELFSKLLFLINSPAQRLATVINATGRNLAVVINQAVEQEKFTASAAEVPSASAPSAEGSAVAEATPVAPASSAEESSATASSATVAEQSPSGDAASVPQPTVSDVAGVPEIIAEAPPVTEAAPAVEAAPVAGDSDGASPQAEAAATEAPAEG